MGQLIDIEAFVAVVKEGSFTAAAKKLNISKSYASRQVTRLENDLGALLLQRSTRALTLTERGRLYFEECAAALDVLKQANEQVGLDDEKAHGRLRISIPSGFGVAWLAKAIANFSKAQPNLTIDAQYCDRQVDLLAEGFDLAVRVGDLPDSGLVARRLAVVPRVICASPAYLDTHGTPVVPDDLKKHDAICYAYSHRPSTWTMIIDDAAISVGVSGPMVANNGAALVAAAEEGLGLIYVPEFHAGCALKRGSLVRVFPTNTSSVPIHVVYPTGRHLPAKVRLIVEFLMEYMEKPPWC